MPCALAMPPPRPTLLFSFLRLGLGLSFGLHARASHTLLSALLRIFVSLYSLNEYQIAWRFVLFPFLWCFFLHRLSLSPSPGQLGLRAVPRVAFFF